MFDLIHTNFKSDNDCIIWQDKMFLTAIIIPPTQDNRSLQNIV